MNKPHPYPHKDGYGAVVEANRRAKRELRHLMRLNKRCVVGCEEHYFCRVDGEE